MYHKQFKNGIAFAILIWSLDMLCLYLTGRFLDNEYVYWGLRIIPVTAVVLVAYVQNHDLKSLGFYPDHLKHDGIVMLCLLVIELLVGVYLYHMPWEYAVGGWLYFIFWVVLQEELVYRGFIQSHLFSSHISRKASCVLRFSHTSYIAGLSRSAVISASHWHFM